MKIKNAEARFYNQHRIITDVEGHVVGFEIPASDDPRKPRVAMRGAGSVVLVEHTDRSRARRRELARAYGITGALAGKNRPYVKPLPEGN